MISKEEMLKTIYDRVSDKSITFGCYIQKKDKRGQKDINRVLTDKIYNWCIQTLIDEHLFTKVIIDYSKKYKVIWHPVMIWDIIQWVYEQNDYSAEKLFSHKDKNDSLLEEIVGTRDNSRKSIEDQPSECIEFIYSLITK